MTPRDLALLRHLAEKVMGVGFHQSEMDLSEFQGVTHVWDPLTNANDTLELIARLDKNMTINREKGHVDGLWHVGYLQDSGPWVHSDHQNREAFAAEFMRAVCEAAGKLTGFEFEEAV